MKKILVIANGEPPSAELVHSLLQSHSQMVAVDGGLYACLNAHLEPDLIIGDFDSISAEERRRFSHIPQIELADQYKSDLEKTLEYLFNLGPCEITVCGALGRRLDHTLTNTLLLCRYPEKVKFETQRELCFALSHNSTLFCQKGQTLSLIPLSTTVEGITTQGLQWELNGALLNKHFIGISNICTASSVSISFTQGDLIVSLLKI